MKVDRRRRKDGARAVVMPLRGAVPGPAVTTVRLLAIADRTLARCPLHGPLSVIVIRFLVSLRLIE